MSTYIGSVRTGFVGLGVQVGSFTGPSGALAVQITPTSGPVDYLQFREAEVRKLVQLLEAALRGEHVGDL